MKLKTGAAFPDFISSENLGGGHYYKKQYQMRDVFLPIILFSNNQYFRAAFYIQIFQGSDFKNSQTVIG